jgi:hypothetical protein
MPVPFVDTALAASTNGEWQPLMDGVLETVTPILPSGDLVPRGRIFVEVQIADKDGMVMMLPWRGYIKSNGTTGSGGPTANPSIRVYSSWKIRVVATQTDRGVSVRVGAHLHVNPDPDAISGAGTFHDEPPGEGRGELVVLTLGDPAAAAEFATITVAALTRVLPRAMQASLVTDVNVANRRFGIKYDDGANVYAWTSDSQDQTASTTFKHSMMLYGALTVSARNVMCSTLPEEYLGAGHRISFLTANLQAGDDWGPGFFLVESWAVPA